MPDLHEVQVENGTVYTLPTGSDTTYTISINGHTLTLMPSSGSAQTVTLPDDDTTYTISISGNVITLTPSTGQPQSITLPDDDTTYSITLNGSTLMLVGSDGLTTTVDLSDIDTTYQLVRDLKTITHMLYVNMDGVGYDPLEDNVLIDNDRYDYMLDVDAQNPNYVYIVDIDGNDIPNISNVNLWGAQPDFAFGQALADYFSTATSYRLKINGELTQKIIKSGSRYNLVQQVQQFDSVVAEQWYADGDKVFILVEGVVLGTHSTIDLVGSDGATTSVPIKATDIGALPTARYHQNSRTQGGYVEQGMLYPNSVWKTDSNGNPAWREESGIDYIVEQGTSGNWAYRKWDSGIAECWWSGNYGSVTLSIPLGTDIVSATIQLAFPFTFTEVPSCVIGFEGSPTGYASLQYPGVQASTTQSQGFRLVRIGSQSVTLANCRFTATVHGKWK